MSLSLEYALGRLVVPVTRLRRQRVLPAGAPALVRVGERVRADQPLAGGGTSPLAGLSGSIVAVAPGQSITIEGIVSVLSGVIGIGGSVVGPLVTLPRGESLAMVHIPRGAVILYPQQAPLMLLQRAAAGGAAGVIAASASALEMEAFARMDLTALLDGLVSDAPAPALTVLLTEGFGSLAMNPLAYDLLVRHLREHILLTGTTDPRRAVRPEALLSLDISAEAPPMSMTPQDGALVVGARVNVALGPLRGARGEVLYIFTRQQMTESGVLAPSATVRFEDGSIRVLPLHALDRIG